MKTKSFLVTSFTLLMVLTVNAQWYTQAPMTIARGQLGAVAHPNGNVYVFGGFTGGPAFNTLEIYHYATDTWSAGAPMPAVTRGMAFALGQDSMIYCIGGFDPGHLNYVFQYNVNTDTWATRTPLPVACWECTAATGPNGKIYVFGGENSISTVQIYDPSTDSWSSGTPMLIQSMMHSAVTAPNGKIYVMGGYDGGVLNSNRIYDPATDSWTTGSSMPNPRNQFGSTLGPDGKIYVIAGKANYGNNSAPFFPNVDIYDPVSDSWTSGTPLPTGIGETEAVTINGGINLLGGTNGFYMNTNYRMDLLCGTLSVTASANLNPICIGSTVTLTASPSGGTPGYAYQWSTGASTQSINVSPTVTTTYTVTVTDDINCVVISQPITVIVNPPLQANATGATTICCSQTTNINSSVTGGDGNYTYTWNPSIGSGSGPFTVSPCVTTTYTVMVSDGCGTPPDTASVTIIVNPQPVLTLVVQEDTVCVGSTVNILFGTPPGGTYFGTGVGGNNFNASVAGAGTHAINYRYTDGNGCSDTITVNIFVDVCSGIESANLQEDDITIFPNPVTNEFRIQNSKFRIVSVDVYDVVGQKHFIQILSEGEGVNTQLQTSNFKSEVFLIEVSDLTPGVYFVIVTDDKNTSVMKKIVKM